MVLEKKPKCALCRQALDEQTYWWDGKQLIHLTCGVRQQALWLKIRKGLDKMSEKLEEAKNV